MRVTPSEEALKSDLLHVVDSNPFNRISANRILRCLRTHCGDHPFTEEELLEEDDDNDFMAHVCIFGSLKAVQWAIRNRVMGPPSVDYSLYTTVALFSGMADEDVLRYLLKKFGYSTAEIPFGDLPEEMQNLVFEVLGPED